MPVRINVFWYISPLKTQTNKLISIAAHLCVEWCAELLNFKVLFLALIKKTAKFFLKISSFIGLTLMTRKKAI